MARNKKKGGKRKDWRVIGFVIISVMIALMMILPYVLPAPR